MESCTKGFLSTEDLRAKAAGIVAFRTHPGQQRLFPDMGFSSEGRLVAWTFAAEYHRDGLHLPELQIWREVADNDYILVGSSARGGELLQTGYLNVYEYHLDQALSFQDGDFLGIFQPRDDNQLTLVSAEGAGPLGHYVFTPGALGSVSNISAISSDNDYPLIAVKISRKSACQYSHDSCFCYHTILSMWCLLPYSCSSRSTRHRVYDTDHHLTDPTPHVSPLVPTHHPPHHHRHRHL